MAMLVGDLKKFLAPYKDDQEVVIGTKTEHEIAIKPVEPPVEVPIEVVDTEKVEIV